MAWVFLFVAGVLEIVWAASLKQLGDGVTVIAVARIAVAAVASFFFFALALRSLPVGPAYAAWTGIGIAGTTILGWLVYGERLHFLQGASVLLIAAGIMGLVLANATAG